MNPDVAFKLYLIWWSGQGSGVCLQYLFGRIGWRRGATWRPIVGNRNPRTDASLAEVYRNNEYWYEIIAVLAMVLNLWLYLFDYSYKNDLNDNLQQGMFIPAIIVFVLGFLMEYIPSWEKRYNPYVVAVPTHAVIFLVFYLLSGFFS
ncbi:MAG: hypothetical protein H6765_06090 [Candidatus Peribacteria bacterium]|nr:MAG: hypothetical protein H6765_06090 [Candidatus Peribacteria bacterium]